MCFDYLCSTIKQIYLEVKIIYLKIFYFGIIRCISTYFVRSRVILSGERGEAWVSRKRRKQRFFVERLFSSLFNDGLRLLFNLLHPHPKTNYLTCVIVLYKYYLLRYQQHLCFYYFESQRIPVFSYLK